MSINLLIIFAFNGLVVLFIKCQKMVTNVDQCFPKPADVDVLNCLGLSTTQSYSVYFHRGVSKPGRNVI